VRALVVDDSAFMNNDHLEMIETARDGKDGVKKTIELRPDNT